jgi:DNA-binding transcriptional ArsR family regulator
MILRAAAARAAPPGSRARTHPAAQNRASERPGPRSRATERPTASIRAPRRRDLMACVSDPSRFQLVSRLALGECCVSDLARRVGLSQSCTTRHLQVLARYGVARGRRQGKRVVFQLCTERATVRALLRWALSNVPAAAETEQHRPPTGPKGRVRSRSSRAARNDPAVTESSATEPAASAESSRTTPAPSHSGSTSSEPATARQRSAEPDESAAAPANLEPPRRRPIYEELEDFLL